MIHRQYFLLSISEAITALRQSISPTLMTGASIVLSVVTGRDAAKAGVPVKTELPSVSGLDGTTGVACDFAAGVVSDGVSSFHSDCGCRCASGCGWGALAPGRCDRLGARGMDPSSSGSCRSASSRALRNSLKISSSVSVRGIPHDSSSSFSEFSTGADSSDIRLRLGCLLG